MTRGDARVKTKLRVLTRRITWRVLVTILGRMAVVNGEMRLLSVELPSDFRG